MEKAKNPNGLISMMMRTTGPQRPLNGAMVLRSQSTKQMRYPKQVREANPSLRRLTKTNLHSRSSSCHPLPLPQLGQMQRFLESGQVQNDNKLKKLQTCKKVQLRNRFRPRQKPPRLLRASLHGRPYLRSTRSRLSQSTLKSRYRNQHGMSTTKAVCRAPRQ